MQSAIRNPQSAGQSRCAAVWPLDALWSIDETRMAQIMSMARSAGAVSIQAAVPAESTLDVSDGVALIDIMGPLTKAATIFQVIFGGSSTEEIREQVNQAAADESVRAILLRVDSPGGSVDGLAEAGDAISAAAKVKAVVAQVTGIAASGAYYLASQADTIYAQRMDLIGSIGTRMLLYDFSKLFETEGIKAIPIDTGEYKSAAAMGTRITENQQAYFQSIVDAYFADFVKMVVRGRPLDEAKVKALADGRVYMATDAARNGLIDGIQNYDETLAAMREGKGNSPAAAGQSRNKENPAMADSNAPPTEPAATPTPNTEAAPSAPLPEARLEQRTTCATIAELKRAFPKSDAVFREECLESEATMEQATTLWAKHLSTENAALRKERDELKAKANSPGVEPLADGGTEKGSETGGDPIERYHAAVKEKTDAGASKADAIRAVVTEQPELHEAMKNAYGPK